MREGTGLITSRPGIRTLTLRFPHSTLCPAPPLSWVQLYLLLKWPGFSRARGGSVSEEVQIKCLNLDRNLGSGSSQAWLGCSLNRGLNHRLHQSRVNQLLGLGLIPGRIQPPGGQCWGWPQRQWINRQGEVTEVRERPGAEVGVRVPRGGKAGEGCSHGILGSRHLPCTLGSEVGELWAIGSARCQG